MTRLLNSSSQTTALLDCAPRAIDETYVLVGEARQLRARVKAHRQERAEREAVRSLTRPQREVRAAGPIAALRGWVHAGVAP